MAIAGDPKFIEMNHFLTSYTHQEPLAFRLSVAWQERLVDTHCGDESPRKDRMQGAVASDERTASTS